MSDKTGYPSIDKPWLKYYPEDTIGLSFPKDNLFNHPWEANKNHLSNNAIEYFGKHISYKSLFERIELLSNAFWIEGVREFPVTAANKVNYTALDKLADERALV